MLVSDECSSWYSRVDEFLRCQFVIGENNFCTSMDQHTRPYRTTPLQSVWSMALSAMMVECERFVCTCKLFHNMFDIPHYISLDQIELLTWLISFSFVSVEEWMANHSPKKSLVVFAASPTERAEWMAHINKCISELLAKSELIFPVL